MTDDARDDADAPNADGARNADAAPDPLAYESSVPGALQPGERVLFECRPHAPPRREPAVLHAALVGVITGMVAVAAASVTGDPTITIVAALVAAFLVSLAVIFARRGGDARRRRELEHITYRVTDRRIVSMDDRPGRAALEVPLTGFFQVQLAQRRRDATVTVGATPFANVPDPARFACAVVELCARSRRRKYIRRMPSHDGLTSRINSAVHQEQPPQPPPPQEPQQPPQQPPPPQPQRPQQPPPPALPDGVALAADETVIWTGRPRVAENIDLAWLLGRLHIAAWLLVPLAFLLSALGVFEPYVGRAHVFFGVAAGILLLAGLYSLLIAPFVQAARRARTWYVLTNIRAIVHTRRGRRTSVTDSYLLDMAGMTELKERSDGTGDVWISAGAMFERIQNPRQVHLLVLDAIRHAGTPIEPPDIHDDF